VHQFFEFTFFCAVVRDTALGRALSTVRLSAAKRATKIVALDVTWIRDEGDAAMHALCLTSSQVGMVLQNRLQDVTVLLNEPANLILVVPVRRKLVSFLDFYCKKPKLSHIILMFLHTPSSYPIGTL